MNFLLRQSRAKVGILVSANYALSRSLPQTATSLRCASSSAKIFASKSFCG